MRQLRIATLGDWNNYLSYFLVGSMEGAVRNGAWFRPVTLIGQSLEAIENQIQFFKPDILLCHCIFNTQPHKREDVFEMLKRVKNSGVHVYYHMGDARTLPRYCGDISSFVTAGLMNHKLTNEFSAIWKVPCYHWPYGALHQESISSGDAAFEADAVFTGSLSGKRSNVHFERTQFLSKLKRKLHLRIFPNEDIGNTSFQTADVSASAKSVLDVQMRGEINGYLSVRPYQYIGSGALFFHDDNENIREIFEEGKHFVGYQKCNEKSFKDKWDYYVVRHPEKGLAIRRQGFEYCQRYHSTKERMKYVIDLYKGMQPKLKKQAARFKVFDEGLLQGNKITLDGKAYKVICGKHSLYIPDLEAKIIWSYNGKIESFKDWDKGVNAGAIRNQSFNRGVVHFDSSSVESMIEEYVIFEELSRNAISPDVDGFIYIKKMVSDYPFGVPHCDSKGVYGYFFRNANKLKSRGAFEKKKFVRDYIDTGIINASDGAIGDLFKDDNSINGYLIDVRRTFSDMLRLNQKLNTEQYQKYFLLPMDLTELKEKIEQHGVYPKGSNSKPYQSVLVRDEYMEGVRTTLERFRVMGMPADLTGTSILDLGSQLGGICLESYKRGASFVTGIDLDESYIDCARDLARYNGYQINYLQHDLKDVPWINDYCRKFYPDGHVKVVFALAMYESLGKNLWEILKTISWETCYLESHNAPQELQSDHVKEIIQDMNALEWCSFEYLGTVNDYNQQCIWKLTKDASKIRKTSTETLKELVRNRFSKP